MPEVLKTVKLLKCSACGHEWKQRGKDKPGQCPSEDCRSALWDRPAKRAKDEEIDMSKVAPTWGQHVKVTRKMTLNVLGANGKDE